MRCAGRKLIGHGRSPFLAAYPFEWGLVRRFNVQEAACFCIALDEMARGCLGLAAVSNCANSTSIAGGVVFCHIKSPFMFTWITLYHQND